MILPIIKYPDPILKKISKRVVFPLSENIPTLINDMFDTMYHHKGIGLSAIQVGVDLNIFVMDLGNNPKIIINGAYAPTLNPVEYTSFSEGCLSVPNVYANVERAKEIIALWADIDGGPHKEIITDLESVCFQHEVDHCEGIIFPQRLSKLKKDMLLKKYKKLNK